METKTTPAIQPYLSEKKPRIWALAAIGGLGSSIAIATFSYIASLLGVDNEWFLMANHLLFISIGIFVCQKVFMSQNKDHMSYRQGLALVALIGIVVGVLLVCLDVYRLNYFAENRYFYYSKDAEDMVDYPDKRVFLLSLFSHSIQECIKNAFISALIILALSTFTKSQAGKVDERVY